MLRRVAAHLSRYAIGNFLVSIAGLLTFPLLTRFMTAWDYGAMSVVSAVVAVAVAFGKWGVQQSVVRLYAEVREGKSGTTVAGFSSSVIVGMWVTGAIAGCLLAIGAGVAWGMDTIDRRLGIALTTAGLLVMIRVVDSALVNLMRAAELSGRLNVYAVLKRYASVALIIGAVYSFAQGVEAFVVASVLAEATAVAVLAGLFVRSGMLVPRLFSLSQFQALCVFGTPMLAFELSATALKLGDRFVIHGYLGNEALGVYAASSNLCEFLSIVLVAPVGQAIVPIYTRLWERDGPIRTSNFLESVQHFYIVAGAAVAAGVSATAPELITLLASDRYVHGAVVIPWVISGLMLEGLIAISGAGNYLFKRTRFLLGSVAAAAVLSALLNTVLVREFGLPGAGMATLSSLLLLALWLCAAAHRVLPVPLPTTTVVKAIPCAFAMYWLVTRLPVPAGVPGLFVKVIVGVASYALMILALDQRSRSLLRRVARGCARRLQFR